MFAFSKRKMNSRQDNRSKLSFEQLAVVRNMEDCITDIRSWMLNNDLKFNDGKTEFLIIGSSQQLEKLDNISIRVGDSDIHPVPLARNLGCWFDSRLSMASHITKICASSFYYLYNIRWIRKYLSRQSTEILVHAFITSCLDYCNGLLYGLPDCLLNKLQRVQNACASWTEFLSPLIYELHWLPIKFRIEFKILLITFKILNFLVPTYLSSLISLRLPSKSSRIFENKPQNGSEYSHRNLAIARFLVTAVRKNIGGLLS